MRQVIFIAGTAYSGSTMLDMILGSLASSFSIGEVRALFHPTKKNHIDPFCGCGDESCKIWQSVKVLGEQKLYSTIFERFPETKTIIDSSKEPFWIDRQKKRLKEMGLKTTVILVWKSPQEFALSRLKRGNLKGWSHAWVNYHRLFFSLNEDIKWRSIEYKEIAVSPEKTVRNLCKHVGVEYNPDMLRFWEKKHHMLFGNTLARYHMYETSNEKYQKAIQNLNEKEINFDNDKKKLEERHRSIYYVKDFIEQLPPSVYSDIEKKQSFNVLVEFLKARDINRKLNLSIDNLNFKSVNFSKMRLYLLRAKRLLKYKTFLIKNRKSF